MCRSFVRSRGWVSGRTDKNTHSDWLYSWRTVLIADIADGQTLKFIAQQSQRMATAAQLFALDKHNENPETETLTGLELIYSAFPDERLSFSISGFWNDTEIIAPGRPYLVPRVRRLTASVAPAPTTTISASMPLSPTTTARTCRYDSFTLEGKTGSHDFRSDWVHTLAPEREPSGRDSRASQVKINGSSE